MLPALTNRNVWILAFASVGLNTCGYGVTLWFPTLIHSLSTRGNFGIGMLSVIPYVFAAVLMVLVGIHSDRTQERRWHAASFAFLAALALPFAAYSRSVGPNDRRYKHRGGLRVLHLSYILGAFDQPVARYWRSRGDRAHQCYWKPWRFLRTLSSGLSSWVDGKLQRRIAHTVGSDGIDRLPDSYGTLGKGDRRSGSCLMTVTAVSAPAW